MKRGEYHPFKTRILFDHPKDYAIQKEGLPSFEK